MDKKKNHRGESWAKYKLIFLHNFSHALIGSHDIFGGTIHSTEPILYQSSQF